MVGCFIVQVLDKYEKKDMKSDLLNESVLDACVVENVYDSPCIQDDDVEGSDHEKGLIEQLCAFAIMKVKHVCKESWLNEESVKFDEKDGTIIEFISNMIQECYHFEEAVL